MRDCFAIDLDASRQFARLSGDFNPLHVDPLVARRTQFGGTAVHGVHLLLKSLDGLLAAQVGLRSRAIATVRCTFSNPVPTGQPVEVDWQELPDGAWQGRASCDGRRAFVSSLVLQDVPISAAGIAAGEFESMAPATTEFPPATAPGSVPLRLEPALLSRLMPALARHPDQGAVADLLASTQVIGMRVPGLHSIYSALRLTRRRAGSPTGGLSYVVRSTDPRFGGVEIAVAGVALEGSLECFYRPAPSAQASLREAQALVQPGEFASAHALVVGGSRGLGEAVVKLLVAGGAAVTFSYARGRQEADALVAECRQAGADLEAVQLDVLEPTAAPLARAGAGRPISHVYYFATPQIGRRGRGSWHQPAFDRLASYYLDGFARLAERPELRRAVYCYPSTIYLDQPEPGFAEYCAAKSAGESLCGSLARERGLRILAPRLERMRTDQTASLSGSAGAEPLAAMLAVVRQVQRERAA